MIYTFNFKHVTSMDYEINHTFNTCTYNSSNINTFTYNFQWNSQEKSNNENFTYIYI